MRLVGAVTSIAGVVAAVLALATYEIVLLVFAGAGTLFGGVALIWLFVLAKDVKSIQEAQGRRIDDLPAPGD